MCWIEYYPVIPEGCYAKKKHIALNKRLSPCSAVFAAAFFKQIKQETSAQTAEEHLNLSMYKMFLARVNTSSHDGVFPPSAPVYKFCPPEECKIVESYHRELGTARLRAADPSCPVCKGEMGKYDALMVCTHLVIVEMTVCLDFQPNV